LFNPSPQANEGVAKSASEAQVSQIGSHAGADTERLVKDAALRLLEQDAGFRAAGKHKVPPRRFAPVGMTELLREGIAQAGREEFIGGEEYGCVASSGCITADGYPVKGPTLVAKNATRMGHPRETSSKVSLKNCGDSDDSEYRPLRG